MTESTRQLPDPDDVEDACLGAVALEDFRRSGEASIPLEQVKRNLGLNTDNDQ